MPTTVSPSPYEHAGTPDTPINDENEFRTLYEYLANLIRDINFPNWDFILLLFVFLIMVGGMVVFVYFYCREAMWWSQAGWRGPLRLQPQRVPDRDIELGQAGGSRRVRRSRAVSDLRRPPEVYYTPATPQREPSPGPPPDKNLLQPPISHEQEMLRQRRAAADSSSSKPGSSSKTGPPKSEKLSREHKLRRSLRLQRKAQASKERVSDSSSDSPVSSPEA